MVLSSNFMSEMLCFERNLPAAPSEVPFAYAFFAPSPCALAALTNTSRPLEPGEDPVAQKLSTDFKIYTD
jgi:hypothetical protein